MTEYTNYLVNVFLDISNIFLMFILLTIFWIASIAISIFRYLEDNSYDFLRSFIRVTIFGLIGILFLVVGVILSLVSPSNTPKIDAGVSRNEIIEFRIKQKENEVIINDITRKPLNTEETRKKKFDDMVDSWKTDN